MTKRILVANIYSEVIVMAKLISQCPACGKNLKIVKLQCSDCRMELSNDFEFSIPAPPSGEPVDGNTPKPGADPSSYTTDGQEKPFKIFVDESQD